MHWWIIMIRVCIAAHGGPIGHQIKAMLADDSTIANIWIFDEASHELHMYPCL